MKKLIWMTSFALLLCVSCASKPNSRNGYPDTASQKPDATDRFLDRRN